WHDHLVRYIKDKGTHAFRNKYGYGQRALVESQISRIKRCIGAGSVAVRPTLKLGSEFLSCAMKKTKTPRTTLAPGLAKVLKRL
ncbi:hypothetical protein AB3X89_40760, partial [Paraburkholderia sp. BR14320]